MTVPAAPAALRCSACGEALDGRPLLDGPDRLHGVPGMWAVVACGRCGSGRTLPEATEAGLAELYPDGYGAHAAPSGGVGRLVSSALERLRVGQALRREPLASLLRRTPGRALDVGCGRGDLAAALVRRGWRVTGVEPSEAACAHAAGRGVEALRGTLGTVPIEPGSYDAAVFQHSLEHTLDPGSDLARVRDALRPGGVVVVSVPNFGGAQRRRFGSAWYHLDLPRHRTHFTPDGLRRALEAAGLEVLAVRTSTTAIGLAGTLQYRLFGRWVFRGPLSARIASTAFAVLSPVARLHDRRGGGDELHALARRP